MDMFNIVPVYNALASRQRSVESQQQVEWAAREADRIQRERTTRALKQKKISSDQVDWLSSWVPSRIRIRKKHSETSNISDSDQQQLPARATAIRWADDIS